MDIRVRVPAQMQTLNTNKNMGATWKRYFVSITRAVLVAVFVKRFMVIYDIMNLSIQEIVLRKTYGTCSPSKFFIKIKHFLFYFILFKILH